MPAPAISTLPTRHVLSHPGGLSAEVDAHGVVRRLALGEVIVNLYVPNAFDAGPANLVLRRLGAEPACMPLLGPRSPTRWQVDPAAATLDGVGSWNGLTYEVALRLADDAPAWFWHVRVANAGDQPVRFDLTLLQDLALAPYDAIRQNEYYVAQYIDHAPLAHPTHGTLLAARQNQAVGGRFPWCVTGSLRRAVAHATDALQVYGLAGRAIRPEAALGADLPGTRLQHEHALAALQDAACDLAPGATVELGFFGRVLPDHPAATGPDDLAHADAALALAAARAPAWPTDRVTTAPAASLYATAPLLAVQDLDDSGADAVFGSARRQVERDAAGRLLGFFHGTAAAVALRAKELAILRPHGQVLRTGHANLPDESALTSTVWMGGIFHSMLTQGHVSINRCLSTARSYLGLFRAQGLRVFVEIDATWTLLDQPSAFEMQPDACRWVYRHGTGRIDVTSRAHGDPHGFGLDLEVVDGPEARFLVCLHVALNGDDGSSAGRVDWDRDGTAIRLRPAAGSEQRRRFPTGHWRIEPSLATVVAQVGGDETLFLDGASRDLPCLTLTTTATRSARFMLLGRLITDGPDVPRRPDPDTRTERVAHALQVTAPAASPLAAGLGTVVELLPWLRQNALVHFLAPRGLEQYSGGGWGTRDVCQGPMELLLAEGDSGAMRELLRRVFQAQRSDGDWPQWFMFFARDAAIRADDSHGDIVFWPLLALGQYLIASGDAGVLDQRLPFYSARRRVGAGPSLWQHALRALGLIRRRLIPGTALAVYGHGDWNDALQPADPALRDNLCSAWTVTLHHQTLTTLATGLRRVGHAARATRLEREARAVRADFLRYLLVDGVLAGYARFDGDAVAERATYLLHPRDAVTGVHYSVLAMIHAIIEGLFDADTVRDHLRLIDAHLSGPDGARLFDHPMAYRGGPQVLFQRAESASYFGREIGLMYMHAHLRYAQALAHAGEAERFFRALCQASPIGIAALVPMAAARQSNCYYSSSDATFADRYEAGADYARVAAGSIALEGGWRVYSSGAGILYGLVVRQLFGLRLEADTLVVDPVLPVALDGLRVRVGLAGRVVEVVYRVAEPGCGVAALFAGARALPSTPVSNPYRQGGLRVALAELGATDAVIEVRVGSQAARPVGP